MLKRVLFGLILLLLLLPFLFGQLLVHQFYRVDDQIQQQSRLKLADASHEVSWQHSQIKRQYRLTDQNQLAMQHDVSYDWFPWQAIQISTQILPNLTLYQDLASQLDLPTLDTPTPLQIQTQVYSPKHIQGQFQLEPKDLNTYLHGNFNYQDQRLDLDQQLKKLQIWGIGIEDIRQTLQWQAPALQTQLKIRRLETDYQMPTWYASQTEQLKIKLNLEQHGIKLWDLGLDADSLELQQNGINLGTFSLQLQAQRLQQDVLKAALLLVQAPALQQKLMIPLFLLQQAPTFLRHSPEVQIQNLAIKSPKGTLILNALLQTDDKSASQLFNIFNFFQSLHLKLDVELTGQWLRWIEKPSRVQDASAIYQISVILQALVQQQWLKVEKDRAVMHLRFEKGQWISE